MKLPLLLLAAFALSLSACGYKGRLKSPAQIEAAETKKAAKQAKKDASSPSPLEGEGGVGGAATNSATESVAPSPPLTPPSRGGEK